MYSVLHELLCDRKGGEIFVLFGFWHFFYIALTLAAITALLLVLRNKPDSCRRKAPKMLISAAFGLYILDFFLMPLAYDAIDIEKLPFHACTAMCVMCFLSYYGAVPGKARTSFVLLGFISNLVYLIYPAGVMWHGVHPLSYRVIQTLIFHGLMTVFGFLALAYECEELGLKTFRRDLTVVLGMTLWAMLGNYAYNGTSESYSHFFNWFFVVRDPFYLLPESVAPFVMPLLNAALFSAAASIVRLIFGCIRRDVGKRMRKEVSDT